MVAAPQLQTKAGLTYPQVFLGEKHIGGCDDLEAYLMLREMGIET
ncbi:hypothetical protein [Candidatus Thioglobus sp.]